MAPPVDGAFPAWSVRLISELEAADQRARNVAEGIDSEQLNWKPRADSWSIAQCLQHLLLANEVYLPPITDALKGRRRARVQEIAPGWFSRWFIRNYIEYSPARKRVQAPGKITPGPRIEPSVLASFLHSNQTARDLVRAASDYDVNRIRFTNPFVPVIRFTVGTGLEIVSRHQRRHLAQAERVRQSGDFPAAAGGVALSLSLTTLPYRPGSAGMA